MNDMQETTNKEFNDIDQALRRAAQTAKKLAKQNGTPYVIASTKKITAAKPTFNKSGR